METEKLTVLHAFFEAAAADSRVSKAHLALYLALFCRWSNTGSAGAMKVFSKEMMPVAKISSSATYHYLIRDLHDYGYIKYEPSFYKNRGSCISLLIN